MTALLAALLTAAVLAAGVVMADALPSFSPAPQSNIPTTTR